MGLEQTTTTRVFSTLTNNTRQKKHCWRHGGIPNFRTRNRVRTVPPRAGNAASRSKRGTAVVQPPTPYIPHIAAWAPIMSRASHPRVACRGTGGRPRPAKRSSGVTPTSPARCWWRRCQARLHQSGSTCRPWMYACASWSHLVVKLRHINTSAAVLYKLQGFEFPFRLVPACRCVSHLPSVRQRTANEASEGQNGAVGSAVILLL